MLEEIEGLSISSDIGFYFGLFQLSPFPIDAKDDLGDCLSELVPGQFDLDEFIKGYKSAYADSLDGYEFGESIFWV